MAAADPLFNQSLEKGLAVLRAFGAQRPTMTLAEIAAAVGITKSSAQRMIHTLEACGYVGRHPRTGRYRLTVEVMSIGYNYLAADGLIDAANPYLSELSNLTGETTNLTEPSGTEMVYVARFVSHKFVPIHMPTGSRIPMYCSGSGRAYLSALPADAADALLQASNRVAHTPHTTTDLDALRDCLILARRRGYAVNCEEMFLGDMIFAAPVLDAMAAPVAAIHVVTPTSRWTVEDATRQIAPLVVECARSVSNAIRALG